MHFKKWIKLIEAVDDSVKNAILTSKWPVNKEIIDSALAALEKEYEGKPSPDINTAKRFVGKSINSNDEKSPTNPKLLSYYDAYKNKKITAEEYKLAELFADEDESILKTVMNELNQLVSTGRIQMTFDRILKKPIIIYRGQPLKNYTNLREFSALIHSIIGQEDKGEVDTSGYIDPFIADIEKTNQRVWPPPGYKGENPSNIYIFKGENFRTCRYFGKGQRWCIGKQPENYQLYREGGQEQYFIFDLNKEMNDPARYVNPGVAETDKESEWVDAENTPNRINGYKSVDDYKAYLKSMGIPLEQIFKHRPYSREEYDEYMRKREPENIDLYRKKSPEELEEFLLTTKGMHADTFEKLTDNEKRIYVIEAGRVPNNQAMSNYIYNLSRKDFKDYMSNAGFTKTLQDLFLHHLKGDKKVPIDGSQLNNDSDWHVYNTLEDLPKDKADLLRKDYLEARLPYIKNYKNIMTSTTLKFFVKPLGLKTSMQIIKDILQKHPEITSKIFELLFDMESNDTPKIIEAIQEIMPDNIKKIVFADEGIGPLMTSKFNMDQMKDYVNHYDIFEWMKKPYVWHNKIKNQDDIEWILKNIGREPFESFQTSLTKYGKNLDAIKAAIKMNIDQGISGRDLHNMFDSYQDVLKYLQEADKQGIDNKIIQRLKSQWLMEIINYVFDSQDYGTETSSEWFENLVKNQKNLSAILNARSVADALNNSMLNSGSVLFAYDALPPEEQEKVFQIISSFDGKGIDGTKMKDLAFILRNRPELIKKIAVAALANPNIKGLVKDALQMNIHRSIPFAITIPGMETFYKRISDLRSINSSINDYIANKNKTEDKNSNQYIKRLIDLLLKDKDIDIGNYNKEQLANYSPVFADKELEDYYWQKLNEAISRPVKANEHFKSYRRSI
jgi:hypothetical protein